MSLILRVRGGPEACEEIRRIAQNLSQIILTELTISMHSHDFRNYTSRFIKTRLNLVYLN